MLDEKRIRLFERRSLGGWNLKRMCQTSDFLRKFLLTVHISLVQVTCLLSSLYRSMQTWKDMCALVLEVKSFVQNLDLSKHENRLTLFPTSLNTAGMRLHPDQCQPGTSSQDIQVCQLIRCLSTLITALVMKLETLETSSTASVSTCSLEELRIKSMQITLFDSLWALLHTSCDIFRRMPRIWPVRDLAEYRPVQDASHGLMAFLMHITRARSQIWLNLWERLGPDSRKKTAFVMLHFPIMYITNLVVWPTQRMLQELASVPSYFVTLLCCVTLELLEVLAPDEAAAAASAAAAAAKKKPGNHHPMSLDVGGIPCLVFYLSLDIVGLLDKLIVEDQLLASGGKSRKGLYAVLINPAVFQLLKRNLLIRHEYRTSNVIKLIAEYSSVESLKYIVDASLGGNSSATAGLHESIMTAANGGGKNLIAFYTPSIAVSDIKLLQVLFVHLPAEAKFVEERYNLVGALFRSWHGGRSLYVPIPASPLHDQVRCVYLAAHHCCIKTLAWMRQQIRQQQKLPKHGVRLGASSVQDSKNFTNTCLQEMILHVCVRPRMHLWESQPGETFA